jgi:hypothetical protein
VSSKYLCRKLSQTKLRVIVGEFGIVHISGESRAVYKLTLMLDTDIKASLKALYQKLAPKFSSFISGRCQQKNEQVT